LCHFVYQYGFGINVALLTVSNDEKEAQKNNKVKPIKINRRTKL